MWLFWRVPKQSVSSAKGFTFWCQDEHIFVMHHSFFHSRNLQGRCSKRNATGAHQGPFRKSLQVNEHHWKILPCMGPDDQIFQKNNNKTELLNHNGWQLLGCLGPPRQMSCIEGASGYLVRWNMTFFVFNERQKTCWVFPKILVSPNHPIFNRVFHYKPSILGVSPIFGNIHRWFLESCIVPDSRMFLNLRGQKFRFPGCSLWGSDLRVPGRGKCWQFNGRFLMELIRRWDQDKPEKWGHFSVGKNSQYFFFGEQAVL